METITLADYILYAFLAFMCLLLVAIVVALWRQARDSGEIKGRLTALERQVGAYLSRLNTGAKYVDANRRSWRSQGFVQALHQRVDLVMRHRHQPEKRAGDPHSEEVSAD